MKPIKTSLPFVGYWDSRQGGRTENQDSCGFIDTPLGLICLVCDGMGGGPAGREASEMAVQRIVEYVMNAPEGKGRPEVLSEAIAYAHSQILAATAKNPTLRGMGTTVTALLINKQSAVVAHVGDSRVYQFRRGYKIFRTADHSMVGELVRAGTLTEEQARLSSQSNIITRALGSGNTQLADVVELPYEAGDRFVLCTDGIWGAMPEKDLIKKVARTSSPSGAVDSTLLEVDRSGRDNGNHHDNFTIALLETKQNSILKQKMSTKTLKIMAGLAALLLLSLILNVVLFNRQRSNPYKEQATELNAVVGQKEQAIKILKDSIQTLTKELADKAKEVADAKMDVANERVKAAAKAEAEAKEKAQQAEEAAQRAQQAARQAQQAQKTASNVLQRIKGVINTLSQVRNSTAETSQRQRLRDNITNELTTLSNMDKRNAPIYNNVKKQLGTNAAKGTNNASKKLYDNLIEQMKKIK